MSLNLGGATIISGRKADPTVLIAANELSANLRILTGKPSPVLHSLPERGTAIVLSASLSQSSMPGMSGQGYSVRTERLGARRIVRIEASTPVGVLYGAYGLLEHLGIGFHVLGPAFPKLPSPAAIEDDFELRKEPAFAVRGHMLHYNFLCGPTCWGLADYQFYFDQMARMRNNLLLMHWYDSEPGAAYEMKGAYMAGGRTPSTLSRPWGAISALRTSQFSFKTGTAFPSEIFSSPQRETCAHAIDEIKQSERMFSDATAYARTVGVRVAAGFEAFRDDPTLPGVHERFTARVKQFIRRNPHLTYFALWQHESGGCTGSVPPSSGTAGHALFKQHEKLFAYLGNPRRVWEAIRFGQYARWANEIIEQTAPGVRLVIVGWGGDRWMRFADYCLGYDSHLPEKVIFTCHDNIETSFGPAVSSVWGELPASRERWAMPWIEGDLDDCWTRQPHVTELAKLCPDALSKGAQGLLQLLWRPAGCEEELAFASRYSWNPALSVKRFYKNYAAECFGRDSKESGQRLLQLALQGSRWTGVRGTPECGSMTWAWRKPHPPFDLDASACAQLETLANTAADVLSEVADICREDADGAFHERNGADAGNVSRDEARPGVQAFRKAARDICNLAASTDEAALRRELAAIEEPLWDVRSDLIRFGMTSRAYSAVDTFILVLHHVQRNSGATRKMAAVQRHILQLKREEARLSDAGRPDRAGRARRLRAMLEFAWHFDSAVMLLADGEAMDQALQSASALKDAGDSPAAARKAAAAYTRLVDAGMRKALTACMDKLDARSDWGTLATINVKPMPLYWSTIERLETLLPIAPPREIRAQGRAHETWLAWEAPANAAAQTIYRRKAGTSGWRRIASVPGNCCMFIHRPLSPGRYDYAVSATSPDGFESPRSHPDSAFFGEVAPGPRIFAARPPLRVVPGEELPLTITIQGDRAMRHAVLHARAIGARRWEKLRLLPVSRNYSCNMGEIISAPGAYEFFVTVDDEDGNESTWPATAPAGLPWQIIAMERS